jgi:hypothetical protein
MLSKAKSKVKTISNITLKPLSIIKLINTTIAPIFTYGIQIIPWNKGEIQKMDTLLRETARRLLSLPNLSILLPI